MLAAAPMVEPALTAVATVAAKERAASRAA